MFWQEIIDTPRSINDDELSALMMGYNICVDKANKKINKVKQKVEKLQQQIKDLSSQEDFAVDNPEFEKYQTEEYNINVENWAQIPFNNEIKHYLGEKLNGGIIVYVDETGHHGLIAANNDLCRVDWYEAVDVFENDRIGWRLPTKDELDLCYLAHQQGIGGFFADYYWCSSVYSASHAWSQDFSSGYQGSNNKYIRILRVRAVGNF